MCESLIIIGTPYPVIRKTLIQLLACHRWWLGVRNQDGGLLIGLASCGPYSVSWFFIRVRSSGFILGLWGNCTGPSALVRSPEPPWDLVHTLESPRNLRRVTHRTRQYDALYCFMPQTLLRMQDTVRSHYSQSQWTVHISSSVHEPCNSPAESRPLVFSPSINCARLTD